MLDNTSHSVMKYLHAKYWSVLTWYMRTTIIGSSAKTFSDKDPLGIIECWKKEHMLYKQFNY